MRAVAELADIETREEFLKILADYTNLKIEMAQPSRITEPMPPEYETMRNQLSNWITENPEDIHADSRT